MNEHLDHLTREELIGLLTREQDGRMAADCAWMEAQNEIDKLKKARTPAGYAVLAVELKLALDLLRQGQLEGTSSEWYDAIATTASRYAWWSGFPSTGYKVTRMDSVQSGSDMSREEWGQWHLDRANLTLQHFNGYYVDLERCKSSASVLDWLCQVENKTWATADDVLELLRALGDLMGGIQAKMCGYETEHMKGRNWAKVLREDANRSNRT